MIHGVILAGGRGERFWPLSRISKPKQFLKLTSDRTMLEETTQRVAPLIPIERIKIVAGESMTDLIRQSADYFQDENILTEPLARNTCLAIGLAAVHLRQADPEAVMVVLSADHLIRPAEQLCTLLEDGARIAAEDDKLVTIGIVPTRPETGYGYIRLGDEFAHGGASVCYQVAAFAEKPKAVVAQEYYHSRKYLWNSGMFIWSAASVLSAIASCRPEMGRALDTYAEAIGTDNEKSARADLYESATSISIDYAVLENSSNVVALRGDIIWDDIGSWSALERYKPLDGDNNVRIGHTVAMETFESTIYNDSDGLIATLGVSDLVVVRSGDITLVAHKSRLGEIKEMLAKIGEDESHRRYL